MNETLLTQNRRLIQQGIELLRSLPASAYTTEPDERSLAPAVGPHFRHCLDFYTCFLEGLEPRVIDYDARSRRPDVESNRDVAVAELAAAAEGLGQLDSACLGEPVKLRRETSSAGQDAWCESSIGRELQFLLSHTVHHYALIALAIRLQGHAVPGEFGVAPSTLEHWRREGRAVR